MRPAFPLLIANALGWTPDTGGGRRRRSCLIRARADRGRVGSRRPRIGHRPRPVLVLGGRMLARPEPPAPNRPARSATWVRCWRRPSCCSAGSAITGGGPRDAARYGRAARLRRPAWLLLLLAAPGLFAVLLRSLADFPPLQLALQGALRALVLAAVAVALAGP